MSGYVCTLLYPGASNAVKTAMGCEGEQKFSQKAGSPKGLASLVSLIPTSNQGEINLTVINIK